MRQKDGESRSGQKNGGQNRWSGIEFENFDAAPLLVRVDPALKDMAKGDFAPGDPKSIAGQGLEEPGPLQRLWAKWTVLTQKPREE